MNYSVFAAIFLVFCTTSTHIFVLKLGQIRSSPSPAFSESSVSWKTQAISQNKSQKAQATAGCGCLITTKLSKSVYKNAVA